MAQATGVEYFFVCQYLVEARHHLFCIFPISSDIQRWERSVAPRGEGGCHGGRIELGNIQPRFLPSPEKDFKQVFNTYDQPRGDSEGDH